MRAASSDTRAKNRPGFGPGRLEAVLGCVCRRRRTWNAADADDL